MIKLKNMLVKEGKELDPKIIAKMAKLTDYNNHTEARIVLAKALGSSAKKLLKAYEAIDIISTLLGQGNETMHARAAVDKLLFNQAKSAYSNFNDINGAY
jgi:hypothetical protein